VIVTSEQTKSYKPDRAIFHRAVKLIGEHPSSIIHIAGGRCEVCGKRGADVRPDFNWKGTPKAMMGFRQDGAK
jgi:hypothetical protein